jgi:tetratricopeptide (TPR) repeat protein
MKRELIAVTALCAIAWSAHAVPLAADPVAEALQGDILLARGLYTDALAKYDRALLLQPGDAVLHNRRGICHQRAGDAARALTEYERALELDPGYAQAWNNLGSLHHAQGRYSQAVITYRRALEHGQLAVIYKNMGTAYLTDDQIENAFDAYRKAFDLDPTIFSSDGAASVSSPGGDLAVQYYYYAKLYAAVGRIDEALVFYAKARVNGFTDVEKVRQDPDFANLVTDARFIRMLDGSS